MGFLGFQQLVDQPSGCVEAHLVALLTSAQSQTGRDMGFPSADPADESYVLALLDVFSIRQLQYLGLVQTGDNAEIQFIQCAQDREA